MTAETDSLGRATFHHIKPQTGVRPTDRELRWLKHIERHGPQSSLFLYELTRDTHRCHDTALRDLQKLRAGGFLRLPPQQRQVAKADFQPYIYDLTPQATNYLRAAGLNEPTLRPKGHWHHAYRTAEFTGSLDMVARRRGTEYIPAHRILAIKGSTLPIPLRRGRLIPDQLFALKSAAGYLAFFLEIDRSTEPLTSKAPRRSLAYAIDQYREVFDGDLHRQHYGIKANTLVLFVFEDAGRQERFLDLVRERAGKVATHFLAKTWPARIGGWKEYEAFQGGDEL